jgi:hypothetical protein
VASSFLFFTNYPKVTGFALLFRKTEEDEYGEFVSMGFGQFGRCYCDIEVIKSKW